MIKSKVLTVDDESVAILRAIHEVNQLMVSAENTTELIQKACESLISTRKYVSAWTSLVNDDGSFKEFASSGLTVNSSRFYTVLKQGFQPDCVRCMDTGIATYQVRHTKDDCGDCLLKEAYSGSDIFTTRIRYKEKHLGYLTVTSLASLAENQKEIDMLTDISDYLGLAISNLDQLKKTEKSDQDVIRVRDDWEKTFDAFPDLIAIIDTDHRIVRANKAMAMKLGCSTNDAVGCRCFEVVHGHDSIPDFCPHARSLLSGKEENSEVVENRIGGTFEVTTTPLFNEEGKMTGSVHVARDITDRKKTDEALQKKIEELQWFNHLMIDRELKMIELKNEINTLAKRLGEEDRYIIHHK